MKCSTRCMTEELLEQQSASVNGVRRVGAENRGHGFRPVIVDGQTHNPSRLVTGRATARLYRLDSLGYGDPRMQMAIDKAKRIVGRDIPLLIEGETGTGKEWFAVAFHQSGPRAKGPFVAVNCAAIPEGLIESELFGYGEGAFTGAKRTGSVGKIQQANGGTLFLDEIGDMPLHLQARLLRVLQDRSVSPLGSSKPHPVDISLVCATNCNIREMVVRGSFREDLYYRLNGLKLMLPPLRERSDLQELVIRLVEVEDTAGIGATVSQEVLDTFRRHPWPGNLRQLSNVIRTSLALMGDDNVIDSACLPEDFLDEMKSANTPPHQPDAATAATSESPKAIDMPAMARNPAPAGRASESLRDMAMHAINLAIQAHSGNISAAARHLGVSRNTLYRKLKQMGMEACAPQWKYMP